MYLHVKFRSCRAPIPKSFHSRISYGFVTFSLLHLTTLYSALFELLENCFSPLYSVVDIEKLSICDMSKENASQSS